MAGDVPVVVDVNGPDELLKSVRVTLSRIDFGQVVDEKVLYEGAGVPVGLILDTTELADATYEATVHVVTVYDTEAHASVRFRVANWRVRVDELPAPMESIFGLIDRSETVADRTAGRMPTDSPGDFFGDGTAWSARPIRRSGWCGRPKDPTKSASPSTPAIWRRGDGRVVGDGRSRRFQR